MRMQRWMQRAIPLAALTLVGAAPALFAQGQQLFEWSGRVDRERQIVMRGGSISTNDIGDNEFGRARARTMSALPRQNGIVTVQLLSGRGSADVIQQPNPQNGFTTIIRVQDPRSGSDMYRVAAYWQEYSGGEYMGRGRGHDRDHDRDDGGYRDRDRDRDNGGGRDRDNGGYNQGGYNNGQSMLHWSGNVDDNLEIRIQNGNVTYRTVNGAQPTSIRANLGNTGMPRSNASVMVQQNQGRGSVTVLQQPAAWNGYTTVIRVRDPQPGYGYYDFNLVWQ